MAEPHWLKDDVKAFMNAGITNAGSIIKRIDSRRGSDLSMYTLVVEMYMEIHAKNQPAWKKKVKDNMKMQDVTKMKKIKKKPMRKRQ
jgi:hypothetical protein